ncbi:MAG TPA: hypothetical protein VFU36_09565 [Jatrophihabitans sp.]|nr:hypothetical protein [Jatrophihabitans sp.]
MTASIERNKTSRRETNARRRFSRRPSRLGTAAGAASRPDYLVDAEAGFPDLLKQTWRAAVAAPDLRTAVDIVLTLAGHVPADVQLRALDTAEEAALAVLCGISWRSSGSEAFEASEASEEFEAFEAYEEFEASEEFDGAEATADAEAAADAPQTGEPVAETAPADGQPAFLGELGLTTSGRLAIRVPGQGPLAGREKLVEGVLRVPWTAAQVQAYRTELRRAAERAARSVADCRAWLAALAEPDRIELLDLLLEAARRTAPFVLYVEGKQYTNFRNLNTITGKTLWPGHPDCALSSLHGLPLELWSDNDVVLVVCLTLLVRSASFGRIEEANGTQLSVAHVGYLLERTRRKYNAAYAGPPVPPAGSTTVAELNELAHALYARRTELLRTVQLYRTIHGALMHKIECVAGPVAASGRRREAALCGRLSERLPIAGASFAQLATNLAAAPDWLGRPHDEFGTGLESLVYHTVAAATEAFDADFAMSRGMRSLPNLIQALRDQSWAEITRWEITDFYCCVVPSPRAARFFDDSPAHLADKAWAMSSRMQYNSWHFLTGNLPKVPEVQARDYFVPPTIPDIAYFSDQHHHGHVAAKVRYSIRSPQSVEVLDRRFNGFLDLRLLRCAGQPFDEQDLLIAHRCSAFLARATSLVAELVSAGAEIEVSSFDSAWHWAKIAGAAAVEQLTKSAALEQLTETAALERLTGTAAVRQLTERVELAAQGEASHHQLRDPAALP